jgi:pimeloyl-ACP methyl ester carboxylesterase
MNRILRAYSACRFGQIHWRLCGPAEAAKPPLMLLHPTAYSGEYFTTLIPHLAEDRLVLAPDAPGHGGSDAPETPPSMGDYAAALADALDTLGFGEGRKGALDTLGFHTGCFLSVELAVTRPDLVRRIVHIGLPFFEGEARASRLSALTMGKPALSDSFDQFRSRWETSVVKRAPGVTLAQAFDHFLEDLRTGANHWWGYHACFTYAPELRIPAVAQKQLVLNGQNSLSEPSRRAAALMRDCTLIEAPEFTTGIFDTKPVEVSAYVKEFLDA